MSDVDERDIISWQSIYEIKINEMEEIINILTEKIDEISVKWKTCINQYSAAIYYDRQAMLRLMLQSTGDGKISDFTL